MLTRLACDCEDLADVSRQKRALLNCAFRPYTVPNGTGVVHLKAGMHDPVRHYPVLVRSRCPTRRFNDHIPSIPANRFTPPPLHEQTTGAIALNKEITEGDRSRRSPVRVRPTSAEVPRSFLRTEGANNYRLLRWVAAKSALPALLSHWR